MTETIRVEPLLWHRYVVRDFSIVPSLAGASHRFVVEGMAVEMKLPDPPADDKVRAPSQFERITCSSWQGGKPTCFDVHAVDLLVALGAEVNIPKEALERVNVSLFSDDSIPRLRRLALPAKRWRLKRWTDGSELFGGKPYTAKLVKCVWSDPKVVGAAIWSMLQVVDTSTRRRMSSWRAYRGQY